MGKVKIDIGQAIQMRVGGASLREIGSRFGTSPEAVRQAFQRAEKKKKVMKKMERLLVAASMDEQGNVKSIPDIAKTIDDWAAILEAAKKGIALESEVASLKDRLKKIEGFITLTEKKTTKERKGRKKSERP
jgi:hypothetical protein